MAPLANFPPKGLAEPFAAGRRYAADLAEDAQFVREHGGYRQESTAAVAMRLGVRRDRLEQALRRDEVRRERTEPELEAG
jgi:hypothetical protein